jgi:3-oxocholest-4-en-26-oate---CoA ligase
MTIEWSLTAIQDVIAEAVPTREMLVWKDVRRTWGEVAERSKGLAGFLLGHSIGLVRDRDELERWECGQVPVALVMHNRPEYVEAMLACYRARAVPFNVNHQYNSTEIRDLFGMVGAGAVIYQRSFGPLIAEAVEGSEVVLVDIDDGSGVEPLEGSVEIDDAIDAGRGTSLPVPSGDDLYLVCTGGTTGAPKGVLWRQADIFVAAMGGSEESTAESIELALLAEPQVWFAAPPFMHAAAQWTAYAGLHAGATVVMHDDGQRFDAAEILTVAEREHVNLMSIVGDAYARPMVEELRRGSYDLSSLVRIGTGGAMTSMENKEALLDLIPDVTVVDGYGASETGGMAFGAMSKTFKMNNLAGAAGAIVLSADR